MQNFQYNQTLYQSNSPRQGNHAPKGSEGQQVFPQSIKKEFTHKETKRKGC
jgi:hypothetical protein